MTGQLHVAMGGGAEFDAIRCLLATWGTRAVGIGDDAAIIDIPAGERLVVSTDAHVEDVHFRREWMNAEEIGARAAAAALSDLAAMAATPRGLLLALGLPERWRGDLEAIARGVGAVAAAVRCPIVGGNITTSNELTLTLTVLGSAVRPLTRCGALAGDILYVTGVLGAPGAALRSLLKGDVPAAAHRARFVAPWPRVHEAQWLAALGAHAAIDISDGLVADASHLACASGLSIILDEDAIPTWPGILPHQAARSGEEYELLVAMPAGVLNDSAKFEREFGLRITAVGTAVASESPIVSFCGGIVHESGGYNHLT